MTPSPNKQSLRRTCSLSFPATTHSRFRGSGHLDLDILGAVTLPAAKTRAFFSGRPVSCEIVST